jgi:glycosyltransferase involved in cell wall biosynthesis
MRVLVDGRVRGRDGIGRYTRELIAALQASETATVRVTVLGPTATPRYSRAEGEELRRAARSCGADVIHLLDCRVPLDTDGTPVVVTVHDLMRVTRPDLCYSDEQFADRFGAGGLAELRVMVDALAAVTGPPAGGSRAPGGAHEVFCARMLMLAMNRAAAVITPTRTVAAQLAQATGRDHGGVVSPWGIDHEATCEPAELTADPPALGRYLLYVGQARAHKGLESMLSAYERSGAASAGARLVLAGVDFAVEGEVARGAIARLGASVVPLGYVDDVDLRQLYRNAEALLHLAEEEGFGFTPLEAFAAGARVIAADIPTLKETLNGHAVFVDPTDADSVAGAIDRVLTEPDLPAHRETRRHWAARCTWSRHAGDVLAVYGWALGG